MKKVGSFCAVILIGLFMISAFAGTPQRPPKKMIIKNQCPFECCRYGTWTALKSVDLFDKPDGKKVIAQLRPGEKVLAVAGEMYVTPVKVKIGHSFDDLEENGIHVGDTIYLLHYTDEAYIRVWFQGKLIDLLPRQKGPYPQVVWWVNIKTHHGVEGWTAVGWTSGDTPFEDMYDCNDR